MIKFCASGRVFVFVFFQECSMRIDVKKQNYVQIEVSH